MKNTRKLSHKNKHLQFYFLRRNTYILFENIVWKNLVNTIKFVLQFFCFAGYLKSSNNTVVL